jgi:hypothetical protein
MGLQYNRSLGDGGMMCSDDWEKIKSEVIGRLDGFRC